MSQHAIKQRTHTRAVNLNPDKVLFRRSRCHFQQGMAHAKTDFQGARRRATEHLVEIDWRVSQRQYIQRRALIETALLAFGHAPGAHHKTLDATVLAILGDSVTTDHISPAGNIKADSPAGRYLRSKGVEPKDFNSYGSRRCLKPNMRSNSSSLN